MSVSPLISPRVADDNARAVAEARVHLAAALRLAVLHELEEGIDNHFTMTVPGRDDQFLILPYGLHWSEARASDMIVFDARAGARGQGRAGALGAMHSRADPSHHRRQVVLHTHQTWAMALNMLQDNRLVPASQTAAFFHGMIAYDDDYSGVAATLEEGERLAAAMGDKPIVFMKNHGVLVTGDTIAQAYRRLYRIERVCRNQVLALSTGRPLKVLSDEIAALVKEPNPDDSHRRSEREPLYFEAMMRVLDRELPGYRE